MFWQGTSLIDAPTPASCEEGVLSFGAQRLRVVSDDPSDIRAVSAHGASFRLHKAGFTVARYAALCDGRAYTAKRTRGTRRDIMAADGTTVTQTRGRADGSLEVHVSGELTLDLVFVSWGLTLVDVPTRDLRY